jgi:hypothetical protein
MFIKWRTRVKDVDSIQFTGRMKIDWGWAIESKVIGPVVEMVNTAIPIKSNWKDGSDEDRLHTFKWECQG